MKRKNIELVIANATKVPISLLPLDVLLIEGTPFTDENKEISTSTVSPIFVKSINYSGKPRKVPYAPISTIFSVDFEQ